MDIALDRASDVPLYQQIARHLRGLILGGGLPPGFRLPPERRLADGLGINRSTVLAAYRELKADGLVDGHVGRGTVVLATRYAPAPSAPPRQQLQWQQLMRPESGGEDPLVRDLLALTEHSDVIVLSIGLPAPELLPVGTLRATMDELLQAHGPAMLTHSPTEGHTPLRESICQLMTARGICCSPAEVLVTSGAQQGLDLLARLLLEPGDTVIVEEPSYFGALQVFHSLGARLIGVPADAAGMRTDVLESVLARARPKLIYTLPTFQNPSGHVMSVERRRHLLELAARHQLPVIEDDPYSDLRYQGEPVPPLKALDPWGCVAYLSTFSKSLFPGLRLGWMAAPRALLRRVALLKQTVDLHSNTPGQWAVDRMIREGRYAPHVQRLRAAYAVRRDAMLDALTAAAPEGMRWRTPEGGFYVWCRLPDGTSPSRLVAQAAEAGVSFLPGGSCFVSEPGGAFIRLNFSHPTPERITLGVDRLLQAIRAAGPADSPATRPSATLPIV